MNIENGLLSSLIEKIRENLQSIVRYEILRGLDKPEANNWTWTVSEFESFEEFLQTTLSNNIYSAATISVKDFLTGSFPLDLKFNLIKNPNRFLLPSDNFLTQEYLNDLITKRKKLFLVKNFSFNDEKVSKLKSLPFAFYQVDCNFIPNNFSKNRFDATYLAKLMLFENESLALKIVKEFEVYREIQNFNFPKPMCFMLKLSNIILPSIEQVWIKVNQAAERLAELKNKLVLEREIEKKEQNLSKFAKEIAKRDYNEELFDQMLKVAN